ncbi:hypothetical protein ZOSMA_162G00450 [Zostera marina]|uniref:Uncharacterized protein n=1 Tax=Zostera marina TaxID=29655 RepID=A0A0K9PU91_ZOSMR|nr:hypothetical protein ZOSMA_162G00450 [Zostera marina]
MGEISTQTQITAVEKCGSVVLDIKSLSQYAEKCSGTGSPKLTKVLSRKGSNRMEKPNADDLEADDASKKIVVKVICSQIDQPKMVTTSNKAHLTTIASANAANFTELGDGRNKRFSRLRSIRPRSILLFFASMSSMGTILLIYFTLAINQRGGV